MYMYRYIYIIYIHMYMYIQCIYMRMHTYMYDVHVCTCIYMCMYTCTCTNFHFTHTLLKGLQGEIKVITHTFLKSRVVKGPSHVTMRTQRISTQSVVKVTLHIFLSCVRGGEGREWCGEGGWKEGRINYVDCMVHYTAGKLSWHAE